MRQLSLIWNRFRQIKPKENNALYINIRQSLVGAAGPCTFYFNFFFFLPERKSIKLWPSTLPAANNCHEFDGKTWQISVTSATGGFL